MDNTTYTAIATGLLVLIGFAQVFVAYAQKRQTSIAIASEYRKRWIESREHWGRVIFIGRDLGDYYQILDEIAVQRLKKEVEASTNHSPTVWALHSSQIVCGILGEVSLRVLQGQISVNDAYSIFGSELLRQSRPLRILLDNEYASYSLDGAINEKHDFIQTEVQDWLHYHDGLRRRCLILLDILWAEGVRLEDMAPYDIKMAAEAKVKTGKLRRNRIFDEAYRVNMNILSGVVAGLRLYCLLLISEYKSIWNPFGVKRSRLKKLEFAWTTRLLRDRPPKIED